MAPDGWKNKLFFGDNLVILREAVASESVDLVYLDPPFNSNASYNVLFGQHKGGEAGAQITAFEDTWHWGEEAQGAYEELVQTAPSKLVELMRAMRSFLGTNDMMAYLTMMAVRLVELHRVLKPMGSLYLHCDPTASHYLKLVMDGVFGAQCYQNEIIWKRTSSHSDGKQGAKHYGRVNDTLFFYTKTSEFTWNPLHLDHDTRYLEVHYPHIEEETGRRYGLWDCTGPGGAAKGNPYYEVMGVSKYWRYSRQRMEEKIKEGRIIQPKPGAVPREKRYLDESKGAPLSTNWYDIPPINSQAKERLGYPTQKPEALLERIIQASSNEGDLILDPFCGCGTTIVAAEKLKRRWIGIDITHLAIALMQNRLKSAFEYDLAPYEVHGVPKDLGSARELAKRDRYHFEWWALSLVDARPAQDKKKGADTGVDGLLYFYDDESKTPRKGVVQVKSGHVKVGDIRDFSHVIEREKAVLGLFVTLEEPTGPMKKEAAEAGFYEPEHFKGRGVPKVQLLTIKDLLGGHRPELPRFAPAATFKQAPRKTKEKDTQGKLW